MVCGKIIYASKDLAAEAVRGSNRDKSRRRKAGLNMVYYCNDCQAWHTSSGGKGKRKKSNKRKPRFEEIHTDEAMQPHRSDRVLHIRNYAN